MEVRANKHAVGRGLGKVGGSGGKTGNQPNQFPGGHPISGGTQKFHGAPRSHLPSMGRAGGRNHIKDKGGGTFALGPQKRRVIGDWRGGSVVGTRHSLPVGVTKAEPIFHGAWQKGPHFGKPSHAIGMRPVSPTRAELGPKND